MRLRGERIVFATARYWAVAPSGPTQARSRTSTSARMPIAPAWTAVHEVLCHTGCQGHAHPWRTDEGRCALDGEDCDRRPQPTGR